MKLPWKYITISFVIGLLLGSAGGLFSFRGVAHRWMRKSPEMFLKRLDKEVHLTDTQRSQILTLIKARHDKISATHEETRKATRAEIRNLLTPAQQTTFDDMMNRMDRRREKRGSH